MDVPEADCDVKLQKISADLIADLDRSLTTVLRKPDGQGGTRIRSFVRARETFMSTTVTLDAFQELPQLLDPHLPKWIPLLADAYLEYCQSRRRATRGSAAPSKLLVPLDYAICRILYAFCKVRGEKVIVRFLNVETRYLEVLLSAIEEAEGRRSESEDGRGWEWEQRYVVLLWLSHLLLAPFDLSTISSVDLEDASLPAIQGLEWPENLPGITMRVIPLAIKFLSSPGKERDAAKALLVRTTMRRDMQQLGVLDCLVRWALASLRPQQDAALETTFFYLGVLSFLAGVLRSSAETSDMNKYLPSIFQTVYGITLSDSELSKVLLPLALVRKMILKVIRSVVGLLLRKSSQDMAGMQLTETAIGYLLESVSDSDTPVRLSASKALSIITLKLDPGMASQVVEAVLESLNRNVLWIKPSGGPGAKPVRDLSAVNHLEWHGLMLTLSHLLYRRSPPARQLSDIIHALLLGLSFDQRGTSGGSVGANVRDAACFGIWAIARRYTSKELLAVPTKSVFAAKSHPATSSILQVLGTELVMTASLDPAGNIRRGASAALQELIGRHPDTVEEGIAVVQTVDYHTVARRSRAIQEVATNATKLSPQYGEAMIDGILGWRGIGDMDAPSRRATGSAFGVLTAELSSTNPEGPLSRFETSIGLATDRIQSLAKRQVEERHGLLLCFASVLDQLPAAVRQVNDLGQEAAIDAALIRKILTSVSEVLEDCNSVEYRKPELIAEGAGRLVVSLLPIIQATALPSVPHAELNTGEHVLSRGKSGGYRDLVSALDGSNSIKADVDTFTSTLRAAIPSWLNRNEPETVEPASKAALLLLIFSRPEDRAKTLQTWATMVRSKPTSRAAATGHGYFHALALAQPLAELCGADEAEADAVCDAFLARWRADADIESRVAILQSLIRSRVLRVKPLTFLNLLRDGLNDYTTNARGDMGSHVRVQALRAVRILWENLGDGTSGQEEWVEASVKTLFYSALRLSAEKLDRVRPEAQVAVALALQQRRVHTPGTNSSCACFEPSLTPTSHAKRFRAMTFSSKMYFETLLNLVSLDCLHPWLSQSAKADAGAWMAELLAGFVTSADTGNDDLVIASRAALTDFCEASRANLNLVCAALLQNLRTRQSADRVVVPTLEIIAFLFYSGLFQQCDDISLRDLCSQTQKAGYKTGNIRKIMACVKVYGGVASMSSRGGAEQARAVREARRRLGALLFHPWPRVRSAVVDELWGLLGDCEGAGGRLMGVDWARADTGMIRGVVQELQLG
ncbi:Tubulin-specific chaperone D [Tolypocladium paradoxum]|uniref:Tubulin-specific chaperone D n=1 Tax=Tolypocladium paradoxum TaxID=94208 RepID=A0A2S4KNY9_9HYPO|nr:Tubulin-specific chaperone D [Tolypocladium paradoxum]